MKDFALRDHIREDLSTRETNSILLRVIFLIPYFLGYKTDFFSFQNNPKDLDPSYKTDLDL